MTALVEWWANRLLCVRCLYWRATVGDLCEICANEEGEP